MKPEDAIGPYAAARLGAGLSLRVAAAAVQDRMMPAPGAERPPVGDQPLDWLFVTPEDSKGWILDAICREIGSRQSGSWSVAYGAKIALPPARTYFFSHYMLYLLHRRRNPQIMTGRVLAWYTHPREIGIPVEDQIAAYNEATCLVFACSQFRRDLIAQGLRPERSAVALGSADADLFQGHKRGEGVVGLSSAFYERKNPGRLLELVRRLPHRRFRLLGRGWEAFDRWTELSAAPNFEYVTAAYAEYPAQMRDFDVFLSLATLEGGPIPLIESMMANAVPVASRTGFSPDVIVHGKNGFLFDIDAPAEIIAGHIEAAFALKGDIRATVRDLTWAGFARRVQSLAERA